MPLAKQSGSAGISLPATDSNKTPITSDAIVSASKNTLTNRTSISSLKYQDVFQNLLSRADGKRVVVEYYRKNISYIDNQLGSTSFSLERNAVHSSYDLIHNFELILKDDIVISQDMSDGEFEGVGDAFIYPGFGPNVGDIFLLKLLDDKIGVFQINQVQKLSVSRSSYSFVNFELWNYLEETIMQKLTASVNEELYFEKDKYFSDSVIVLTNDSYQQLNFLKSMRTNIIRNYKAKFYNPEAQSFVSPDNLYDPYLIEFLFNRVEATDMNLFQLASGYVDKYQFTIWNSLIRRDLSSLYLFNYVPCKPVNFAWDVGMTLISRYDMVFLKKLDDEIYDIRMTPLKINEIDANPRVVNYFFSNLLYYALLKHYENPGVVITDVTPLIPEIEADPRFFTPLSNTIYSIAAEDYITLEALQLTDKLTGTSNNDMHLSELEYYIYDYLVNNNINTQDLVDDVLKKYPFVNMTDSDRFYYFPVLLQLIDAAIIRLT